MSRYIKAEEGLNHSVIYTDDSGKYFRFSGGTWTWRNHNPGNLFPASVSAKHNQIGRTKHFAIFPDYENGHLALLDCLQNTYGEKSIEYLISKFAPAEDDNDVEVYTKFLRDKTGVYDNKAVKDFTPDEFDKLWSAIEKMEGHKEGTVIEVFPVIQVHINQTGIYECNIKTKGWLKKRECIQLAKEGVLDLIVCRSKQKHEYLRARKGSSINGSLDKLVVKNHNKERHSKCPENITQTRIRKEKINAPY